MTQIIDQMTRRPVRVAQTSSFDLQRADAELRRLAAAVAVLQLIKGFYALVPADHRERGTTWQPTVEGVALGMAAALYGTESVPLIGPSVVRAHIAAANRSIQTLPSVENALIWDDVPGSISSLGVRVPSRDGTYLALESGGCRYRALRPRIAPGPERVEQAERSGDTGRFWTIARRLVQSPKGTGAP